ncbi:hypothetical protein MLD38_040052 [Melastoma candidum]|uniref:Uncharacterized protein n=1 Tax=Melastoma candidum TaxID=119954 RepID=A0ACB9L4T3_9MYRT|nr:hypothetical protein MLD38_040052 [Melastoma candidum]
MDDHYQGRGGEGDPRGTIIFSTVGRPSYGFDLFSLHLPSLLEHPLTDSTSVNYNASFLHDPHDPSYPSLSLVFVSERSGYPCIYLSLPDLPRPLPLPSAPGSLFHDRPIIRGGRLYFISAHEDPGRHFRSWSALYVVDVQGREEDKEVLRLTPSGSVDYSPSISESGDFAAVASYGTSEWKGEFHALETDVVVFRLREPKKRAVLCERGGWPTWYGDNVVYFHREAEDGWWSIFRAEFDPDSGFSQFPVTPTRVTPPGVHCFTPAAMKGSQGGKLALATRRSDRKYRHIEIFDIESGKFMEVTKKVNPEYHHYNPFVSQNCEHIGYHRFRGKVTRGEKRIPHLETIKSPMPSLRMLRLNGLFPASSPDGDLVAFNHDFLSNGGIKVVRSDGSRRWTLIKGTIAFCNSWSPTEKNVIYTSIGPIFQSPGTAVQIARVTFDLSHLGDDCEEIACDVKVLTRESMGNNAFPSCSPDGKYLVFRSGRSGNKNLYIVNAVDGEFDGDIRQLTNGPWIDTMPSWSPDGELIAFSSNMHNPGNPEAFSIYLIKPDGTGLRRVFLTEKQVANRERINHVCFSKDGEWLLFTANLGGVTAEPVSLPNQFQPYGELYVARLDGSGLRRLTWNAYEDGTPTWHSSEDVDIERLSLSLTTDEVGDELTGEFDEPLWISCDI